MKIIKKKYFWIVAVLIVSGIGYYWHSKAGSDGGETRHITVEAKRGAITTSVSASGNVIVDQLANIDPTISGTVYGLAVSVGDTVKKGQLLFMIDNDQLGIDADKAYSSYLQATASLENAKAGKKEAKNAYDDSNSEEKKITKKKLDASEISVEVAERNVRTSWKSYQNAYKDVSKTKVVSIIDGTVNEINIENGDSLNDSLSGNGDETPIIIGDLSTMKAQVQINEVDIPDVKVGQAASIAIDAIEGLNLPGKVEKIDALGTTNSGVVTYGVTISFDLLDERIKPDMSVSAEITTNSKEGVVVVPSGAIKTRNGKNYVQVMNGEMVEDRIVEPGLASSASTEIVSGVNEGESIITRTIGAAIDTSGPKGSDSDDEGANSSDNRSNNRDGHGGFPGGGMMMRM